MAAVSDERGADALRVFGYVGLIDLACALSVSAEWLGSGLVDPSLFLTLVAVRVPIWVALLWWLLGPIRAWSNSPARARGPELVAVTDAAMTQLPRGFAISYTAVWAVVQLGLLVVTSPGWVETLAGLAFLVSAVVPALVLVAIIVEHALLPLRRALSVEVVAANLLGRRPATSLSSRIGSFCLALIISMFAAMAGFGSLWVAEGDRAKVAIEERYAIEHVVHRIGEGDPMPETVQVVTAEELPELAREGLSGSATGSWAGYLADAHVVMAVATLDDDRVVVTESVPPDDSLEWLSVMMLLGLGALPAVWVVARLLTRTLIGPLEELAATTQAFVERGKLDAIERIVPLHNDEVGRVTVQLNGMLDVLEQLAHAAEAVAEGDLEVTIEHEGDLPDAFRAMVARLAEAVSGLRETSVELASVASEIHGLTQSQGEAAEVESATVAQVGSSVSALSGSAENIAKRAQSVMQDAERAVEMTSATSDKIAALRAQTINIGELVDLIGSIADRSDILALNGSLEAVRAGEVGRGFALVAAEMRRLAEQVGGSLNDVRTHVGTIDQAGAQVVAAIQDNRQIAERTAIAAAAISEVTLLQSAETREAWSRMEEVMGMVVRSSEAIVTTQQAALGLREQAEQLEALLAGFRVGDS